jgi:caspase domain-containing protein
MLFAKFRVFMAKRALLVGINQYAHVSSLSACVADATAMAEVLSRNADGSVNFDCRLLTAPGPEPITKVYLRQQWRDLFHDFRGDVLFYFSGHGTPTDVGGYLVTPDGVVDDPGLPMEDVVTMANRSSAETVLLILDCCFSGSIGNPAALQPGSIENRALVREGVTILAASRPTQVAVEVGEHGVFTNLVLGALRGGAADVRGHVSAASIYAYAEAALGAWDQRPLYKSHAARLNPVRTCAPRVSDELLRELPHYFGSPGAAFQLDMTYEETNSAAVPKHVVVFKKFKRFQIAGLLKPRVGDDLYWTAARSEFVELTDLGAFYLQLVRDRRL